MHGAKPEEGVYYVKLTEVGRIWMNGTIIALNCVGDDGNASPIPGEKVARHYTIDNIELLRCAKHLLLEPKKDELDLIEKNFKMTKKYFVDSSDKVMDVDGKVTTTKTGDYIAVGVNFKMTRDKGELVLFLKATDIDKYINVPLSQFTSSNELNASQKKIIASWVSSELKSTVTYNESKDKFEVETHQISAQSAEFPGTYNNGPYLSIKQAQDIIDGMKYDKAIYKKSNMKITKNFRSTELTLAKMIAWLDEIGITLDTKKFLEKRAGATKLDKYDL